MTKTNGSTPTIAAEHPRAFTGVLARGSSVGSRVGRNVRGILDRMAKDEPIRSRHALREQYGEPSPTAVAVTKPTLDEHHRRFIAHSPFACIASTGRDGYPNVSPRGGRPGFVHVLDDQTLVMPDRPGNNKIETLENLIGDPKIGLIFFVPGARESVRVQGMAWLVRDPVLLELGRVDDKLPATALVIHVAKAYLHCGKAVVRARLWDPQSLVRPGVLPSFGQMIKDQADVPASAEEIQDAIEDTYRGKLY